jgi:hypothetical protein
MELPIDARGFDGDGYGTYKKSLKLMADKLRGNVKIVFEVESKE